MLLEDTETNRTVGNALAEAERKPKGEGYQWNFGALVARNRTTYIFLDYVFDARDGLHGAVGSSMVPVTQEEFDRRLEEYKDYEWSPIAHLFDREKENGDIPLEMEWSEWISEWSYDLPDLVLDDSYVHKYGATVREKYEQEDGIEAEYVECIGGGRMFRGRDYDTVYRPDLLTLIKYAEQVGLSAFF